MTTNSYDGDERFNLWWLIDQMYRVIYRARGDELRPYGISPTESAVLFAVQAIGKKATPAEISQWMIRQRSSLFELLNRMERKGLLKKVKDPDKKGTVRIVLTEKGRKAYRGASNRESIHLIISALDEVQIKQMKSYCFTLRASAQKQLGVKRKIVFPPEK